MTGTVNVRREQVTIPTYRVGRPDNNPMFLEKRVYQGSSGAVYPYQVIESVDDTPVDCHYDAITIENEFVEVMVLPELGGRVQRARDKTNGYDFIYHNRVIKPALVGLAGPWISGGIEFNWPQHHRPNTFGPVAARTVKNPDGSMTVWCGETDRMYGTRGLHGLTLHPGKALLEVHGRVYNPTAIPQTFLWWANPAVSVHDDYQSIFPPDVTAVMDHGKRDVSTFPVATGIYYKVDYRPGTDISWYGNLPVPTSYMAHKSNFDFVGGYDHRRQAGLLHVADHHVSPGKKQWTWGCGDFGRAWDRNLTDGDGPYFELMTGVYTDNQPDFSWLMPCEEKRFVQTFLPYKSIGHVRKANQQAALSLEVDGAKVRMGVYLTAQRDVTIVARNRADGTVLCEERMTLSPHNAWVKSVDLKSIIGREDVLLSVYEGVNLLIDFTWAEVENHPIPKPASPAPAPRKVATNEELVLWGRHLEQYRHATREPLHWYEEALKRDPSDMEANCAMGKLLMRRGRLEESEAHLRRAVGKALSRNPNPYNGEPLYHLGACLYQLGRHNEAFDLLAKAAWNNAWKTPACLFCARILCHQRRLEEAADLLEDGLETAGRAHSLRQLYITVLRHLRREGEALAQLEVLLKHDPVNPIGMNEARLMEESADGEISFLEMFGADMTFTVREVIREYDSAGFRSDALELVGFLAGHGHALDALSLYQVGDNAGAASQPIDGVFPNRVEDILMLREVTRQNPKDANAWHMLGNALYDKRQYDEAIMCWETAREHNPDFPTTHRNLGIALFNKRNDVEGALAAYGKAVALAPDDARVFYEYDQLLKRIGRPPAERLTALEERPHLVRQRDDLVVEHATLLNLLGQHDAALEMLTSRNFHPWEGGEGKVTRQYVQALIGIAETHLREGRAQAALDALGMAGKYPENLAEGKLFGMTENDIHFLRGVALFKMDRQEDAGRAWELATRGTKEPASAWFYNDQPPELIYYQGLALEKLGRTAEARERFEALVDHGENHMEDTPEIDFFAVSLPDFLIFEDDLVVRNKVHCHLVKGLGLLGLGERSAALEHFHEVLRREPSHQEAARQAALLDP